MARHHPLLSDARWPRWALLLALVPGLWAWRLAASWLSGAGLFVDEAQYWDWSRQLAWGYYSKPPVLAALIRLSTELGGHGLAGVRWLVVLLWTLTPVVLWRLAWEMLRDTEPPRTGVDRHWTGAWAAVLASACLLFAFIGQVATTDGTLLFLWAVQMWLFWRAWQRPGRWIRWGAWGACLALGILSKYTAAAAVASALLLALRGRDLRVWFGIALAGLVCGLGLVPHLLWNQAHGWPTLRHSAEMISAQGAPAATSATALQLLSTYAASQLLLLGPVVLALVLAWAWRGWRSGRGGRPLVASAGGGRLVAWAWTWAWPLWLVGAVQSLQGHSEMNWPAPAVLGCVLALALWRHRLPGARRWLPLALALYAALCMGAILSLAGDWRQHLNAQGGGPRWDLWSRARGWDAAFEAMAPAVRQHPQAVLVSADRTLIAHSAYAWRDWGWRPLAWRQGAVAQHHYELLHAYDPQAPAWRGRPVLFVGADPDPQSLPAGLRQAFGPPRLVYRSPEPGRRLVLWHLEPR